MAILQPNLVAPTEEEQREGSVGQAIFDKKPVIPGVVCVRGLSPLAMHALMRSNNPFVTGKKGFEAAGIAFVGDSDEAADISNFALAMMPYTAAAVVCFTCSEEDLMEYADDPKALKFAAFRFMEHSTNETLAAAMVVISEKAGMLSKSRAVPAPSQTKPEADLGGGNGSPKKRARTGSRKF